VAAVDDACGLEDLREASRSSISTMENRPTGMDRRRRIVMIEPCIGRTEMAERIPCARVWAGAKVDPPQERTAWKNMNLGTELPKLTDGRRRRKFFGHWISGSDPAGEFSQNVRIMTGNEPLQG